MLAGVEDGSHPYCVFLSNVSNLARHMQYPAILVSERQDRASSPTPKIHLFYRSCIMFLLNVADTFPALHLDHVASQPESLSPSPPSFFPFRIFSMPTEIIHIIFSFILKRDLIGLRTVNRTWLQLSTRFTHNRLCLSLPPNWQEFLDGAAPVRMIMEDYMLTTEILVVYLMSRWDLTLVVEEVVLVNWPA
ncbi:hypothetical protein EV421DRAFT_1910696 [Armillaria borealis]|uniref:F-box domain-containing protein n=1 Tax=Armillaria borealis TaxID=47425 RepID=A0AA39J1G4_9AGAR|nr:hypothetical protein EV421DRAFT_1910696 [Armillaria borealis]